MNAEEVTITETIKEVEIKERTLHTNFSVVKHSSQWNQHVKVRPQTIQFHVKKQRTTHNEGKDDDIDNQVQYNQRRALETAALKYVQGQTVSNVKKIL